MSMLEDVDCMETCQIDVPCPHNMDCDHLGSGRLSEYYNERVELKTYSYRKLKWNERNGVFYEAIEQKFDTVGTYVKNKEGFDEIIADFYTVKQAVEFISSAQRSETENVIKKFVSKFGGNNYDCQ